MDAFDLLAGLTARLASTARLDEIADAVVPALAELGFGAVWIAVLDDQTGKLATLKDISADAAVTPGMPKLVSLDLRQPPGHGGRRRGLVNVVSPDALHLPERDEAAAAALSDELALPRALYRHLRGRPFACGFLLGSSGQPVGALALSAYQGARPIPEAMVSHRLLRAIMDHLAIAMERALLTARVDRLDASLGKAQAAILDDARLKAVGQLAASAAHDLNNLSGIALLAAGVGLRSPADAFDVLPQIERANRAIGDLVARLQRIARPPSSDAEAANLRQIVDDVLIMATPTLREQSIEIDVDFSSVPLVRCDAVLIHQVVLNLLLNARDALGEIPLERRRIEIRVRDAGEVVRLTVADSGRGIAPEILAHLFEPFSTTKGSRNLGLGLASARSSLLQFGARIEGRNAPTGGAVFEVTLVAAPPGTPDSSVQIRPGHRATTTGTQRRAKILAVDDDLDVIEVILANLAYLEPRYEVITATDPAEAIVAATTRVIDLVLCDIGLPKQSGLDVCVSLRQAGYRGKLVLMTGWDSQVLSNDQRAAECDALLQKPFSGADLIHMIDSVLDA